jgi:hypothetical protein
MRQVWPDEGLLIPKSIFIKGQGCKSGRCAAKAVVLTPGGLQRVSNSGLIPMSSQTTIFVILSAAKNLSVEAAEILHSATLRSE